MPRPADERRARHEGKDPAAVALGRRGGQARAQGLSKKRRKEIAKKAAQAMAQIIAAILAVALLSVSPHDMSEDVRKVINHCVQPPCQGSLTS